MDNLDPPAAALRELVVQIDAMHQRPWIYAWLSCRNLPQ